MSVNGRRKGHTRQDLLACARRFSISARRANAIIDDVLDAVATWPRVSRDIGVDASFAREIERAHRVKPLRQTRSPSLNP